MQTLTIRTTAPPTTSPRRNRLLHLLQLPTPITGAPAIRPRDGGRPTLNPGLFTQHTLESRLRRTHTSPRIHHPHRRAPITTNGRPHVHARTESHPPTDPRPAIHARAERISPRRPGGTTVRPLCARLSARPTGSSTRRHGRPTKSRTLPVDDARAAAVRTPGHAVPG